ncbi:hypothetical protein L9F63_017017, partial [Diploptera punctata]
CKSLLNISALGSATILQRTINRQNDYSCNSTGYISKLAGFSRVLCNEKNIYKKFRSLIYYIIR